MGSFVAAYQLSSRGSGARYCSSRAPRVAARGLSCSVAGGILVPQPGTEPVSPALHGGFLTTGPPGKSRAPKQRKVTRETCATRGSYQPRLHGRPGLEAALFSLAPATIQQHQLAKGTSPGGEFKQGHAFHTESHLMIT